ncbi:MAG: NFACT RNA binding domain-containing protein, partial [Bacteroidota bacterium]
FLICFESNYKLLFKMHGKRSNVILYEGKKQLILFNSQMKFDLGLQLNSLERNIRQDQSEYLSNGLSIFPTFDQTIKQSLYQQGYSESNDKNWDIIQQTLRRMDQEITIFQKSADKAPQLTLCDVPDSNCVILKSTEDPLEAANEFYYQYTKIFYLQKEKGDLVKLLNKQLKKTNGYLSKTSAKLEDVENNSRHQEVADILMANLHNIKPNASEATLFDFYKNEQLKIKLKKDLSPQKNAEYLYRKAKNQRLEIDKLYENLVNKEDLKESIEAHIAKVSDIDSLKDLRKYAKNHQLLKESSEAAEVEPFKKVVIGKWVICIGRNARSNDELTQKYTHKNDLWLHAKDVSGSHVVIKQIPGTTFSQDIIEKAAQLAAYYSKRKTDSLCPVIYTPKKYVRKPKGLAPGQVIVDREEVILVTPSSLQEF